MIFLKKIKAKLRLNLNKVLRKIKTECKSGIKKRGNILFKYLKSTPVSSTQLKMSINIFERYLHTESSLVRFFWTSLRLCHKRVRLTMPSKRHSWEADVTDCYQLSVDMLLLVVVGMMSLDKHLERKY